MGGLAPNSAKCGFRRGGVRNGETLSIGAARGLEAGSRPSVAAIEGGRSVSLTPNGQAFSTLQEEGLVTFGVRPSASGTHRTSDDVRSVRLARGLRRDRIRRVRTPPSSVSNVWLVGDDLRRPHLARSRHGHPPPVETWKGPSAIVRRRRGSDNEMLRPRGDFGYGEVYRSFGRETSRISSTLRATLRV